MPTVLARLVVLQLLQPSVAASLPSAPSAFPIGRGQAVLIEQEYDGAEEGSVVWDCSRALIAHLAAPEQRTLCEDARVLEIGAGTGIVGIALARLGAVSCVLTDKHSQLPLMQRNILHNEPGAGGEVAPTEARALCWEPGWRRESEALAQPDAFDLIVCCDCVYPSQPSDHLATLLLELLELNPRGTLLLAFEHRPPPASAPPGTDHPAAFFAQMAAGCEAERVPAEQLDERWRYDEFELWRMRWRASRAPRPRDAVS